MSTNTHLPGPWGVNDGDIFSIPANTLVGRASSLDVGWEANARLMAAAPSYHDAVEAIHRAVRNNCAPMEVMYALGQVEADGGRISLDCDLLAALFEAHAKA